ncbi:myb-binding protein 1A-like protein [Fundulus heteroclitus]|uniref:myb-binding protein 1A-like protein n=1 Tax=Fundulus heteroclitus TaxID=8078 RepID=UPI00165AC363|nr:myb-binding protein 1A-like protein [Fundulus heteroclitus]
MPEQMSVEMVEVSARSAEPPRPAGVLQQNRVFLDFFWDLAAPEQEVRLKAVENLIQYLKAENKADELAYTFKRLVDGLAHTREAARPGFSLALGQVLSTFEDVSLQSILDRIKEKHNLQSVKKKLARNAMFGNLFGVLALQQSGRLVKEPQVVLGCVQLLQSLNQHKQHLKDLPSKTMTDILSQIPEEVFEEVLFSALKADLASAFRTPEQLQLLLVALQRFPQALKPKKLKQLLGSSTIINAENIPKLVEVLKMAAHSVKKELVLPSVALDLLKLSLKEDSFQLFWNKAITEAMFKEPSGPTHYLSFRLLGRALPLLSLSQLKEVLSGEVMMHYGEHVVSAQRPDRFKLAPEMDGFVSDFLQACRDADKQLVVVVSFSSLTNNGYPVVPSVWRVVQHLEPAALQSYVDWLKKMFLQPQMDQLLDFSTRNQKDKQEGKEQKESTIFRLRKWIVPRLASIVDNHMVKKSEDLCTDVARFVFFHAFFSTKKATADIAETSGKLSVPLDAKTRGVLVNSFFGPLMSVHHMPLSDDSAAVNQRRSLGATADGTMWILHLAQYAQLLLSHPKHVQSVRPFSAEQKQAWDGMLESVANLRKKTKKGGTAEIAAFQQLFLLVGMHLFKAPDELLDIMKDLQRCVDKAQEKKAKKKKKTKQQQAAEQQEEEPEWVEVLVDILLSLLSQQSRHVRQVCKTVFSSICPHVTAAALTAILDVLDPDKEDEEDSAVVVTDDGDKTQKKNLKDDDDDDDDDDDEEEEEQEEEEEEDMEADESDESDNDSDEEDAMEEAMEEEDEKMEGGEVDQNFRMELMKVLQQQNALATEEDADSDEDLDDEAMMKLDKSLSALFSEQKKKLQAKKDEKAKLQKERVLLREFKIKVLDLVEVFVARQAGSPLILGLVEPLLNIIERGMSSGSEQQEQEFLRRAADIFRNHLCRSRVYCKTAGDRQGELHDLLEKLMSRAQKLSESSVCLYYFSASLYVVKVLRGPLPAETKEEPMADGAAAAVNDPTFMGSVDVDRVSTLFREALISFMSRRKSPLTTQMFTDLFNRFPVLCVSLLETVVQHITAGLREHQQGQACVLVLRAMQNKDVQQIQSAEQRTQLCEKVSEQLALSIGQVDPAQTKVGKEKLVKTLELCQFLVKHVHYQKLPVDLEPLKKSLDSLTSSITFKKTGQMEDTYWAVMKHFGVTKPKVVKTKPDKDGEQEAAPKKKKGFLPESKKRKKRNKPVLEPAAGQPSPADKPGEQRGQAAKKQDKKAKQKRPAHGAAASPSSPAKKSKTQPDSKAGKKKKKPKQKKGVEQA